ncbi:MAG: MarR family transcriptional regulator [Micrococcales bacterium]|nr:MarR family transcriptional regulator [Micrococcales bacterium]
MWRVALADAGVAVETVDADHVRLSLDGRVQVMRVRRLSNLMPSRVPDPVAEHGLLVAPSASQRALEVAVARGWSVASDAGRFWVQIGPQVLASQEEAELRAVIRPPGPPSWSLFAVVRRLLAGRPALGVELAAMAGVSQSRTSRVLSRLVCQGLVERGPDGYRPTEWHQLLGWWMDHYPGPGGMVTYWASTRSIQAQAADALDLMGGAVSGDVAADLLAPWRIPTLGVVYVRRGVRLGEHGFVPVGSAEEATLAVCAPADPGVWLPTAWLLQGLSLADPLQILFDVRAGPEPDRAEAADRLVNMLTSRHLPEWQTALKGSRL